MAAVQVVVVEFFAQTPDLRHGDLIKVKPVPVEGQKVIKSFDVQRQTLCLRSFSKYSSWFRKKKMKV